MRRREPLDCEEGRRALLSVRVVCKRCSKRLNLVVAGGFLHATPAAMGRPRRRNRRACRRAGLLPGSAPDLHAPADIHPAPDAYPYAYSCSHVYPHFHAYAHS